MTRKSWLILALLIAFALTMPLHFNNPSRDHPATSGVNDHGTGAINLQCGSQRAYVRLYPQGPPDNGNVRLRVRDFDTGTWYGIAWNGVNVDGRIYWHYQSSRDDISAAEGYFDNVGYLTINRFVYGCA
jgi:hypothetical protein